MQIKGLYTALITPFDNDGNVDEEGLRFLINYQIEGGVDGIVLLGTTGEAPTLDMDESERVIKVGIEEAAGRVPIMVGCGTYATKTTIKMAAVAELAGADSLLVVTPYYNKPTQEGIYLHYKAITDAVSLPLCVYNIASRTAVNIETATLERLAELPTVVSVKEASGNISQMMDVVERVVMKNKKKGFSMLSGDDALILPLYSVGGHGVISVISNLIPRKMKELLLLIESDIKKAQELFYAIKPLINAAFIETNPIPIKEMMAIANLPSGKCRLPLCRPLAHNRTKLQELLKAHEPIWNEVPTSPKYQAVTSSRK